MGINTPQQRLLNALQDDVRTWEYLKSATKLDDARLGFTLGELLNGRLIWTAQHNDVRVYGLEKRLGLRPRFPALRRRETE